MAYLWHREYYRTALKNMAQTAGELYKNFIETHGEFEIGYLDYFEQNHPSLHKKYADALIKIQALWGNMMPEAMEQFKAAVKIEVEAVQWAVERWIQFNEKNLSP